MSAVAFPLEKALRIKRCSLHPLVGAAASGPPVLQRPGCYGPCPSTAPQSQRLEICLEPGTRGPREPSSVPWDGPSASPRCLWGPPSGLTAGSCRPRSSTCLRFHLAFAQEADFRNRPQAPSHQPSPEGWTPGCGLGVRRGPPHPVPLPSPGQDQLLLVGSQQLFV